MTCVKVGERLRGPFSRTSPGRLSRSRAVSASGKGRSAGQKVELMTKYGAEYPLPNLLDHLAMPGCSKIKSQWDRCLLCQSNRIARTIAGPKRRHVFSNNQRRPNEGAA